jgi:hypothetical protein
MMGREADVLRVGRWFAAYVPEQEDGCYIQSPDGLIMPAEAGDVNKVGQAMGGSLVHRGR